MNLELMQKVSAAYPERPVLNASHWPYRPGRLDELVAEYMDLLDRLRNVPVKHYLPVPPAPPLWAGNISKQRRPRRN